MSVVGQAFVEVLPLSTGFSGALQKQLQAGLGTAKKQAEKDINGLAGIGQKAVLGVGAAVLAVGAYSLHAAANFETLTTSLVTGAGESEKNIGMIRQGILNLAPAMGTSTTNLTNGLYMIESAGFHGAAGLQVLKAAAEGAKVGNADLSTVANAVTTALTDYHLPAQQAASVTSMLVETVASGKTHMQDLAGALSAVLPIAAAAHISLADVTGAIATMTGQGISAQQASQDLANTIRQLQNPSHQAIAVMEQFGISSTDLAQNLGKRGVSGSLDVLVSAISSHMGPAGLVLEGTFKKSQAAAKDAQAEFAALPPSLRKIGQAVLDGTISQKDYRASMKTMTLDQRQLISQLKATVDQTRGFSSALKSGTPEAKTMSATLAEMLGGATGLNVALALTGPNMATYRQNIANISQAGKSGATTVQGFALVQKDFGFQVDQAKQSVQVLAIQIGMRLIPIVETAIGAVKDSVEWLTRHKTVALALAGVIGGALSLAIAAYAAKVALKMAETVADFVKMGGKFIANNARMIASVVEWAAAQAASLIETASLWVMYTLGVESAGLATVIATGGIILAVAAIAAGVYLLIKHWKQVAAFFVSLWGDIEHIFGAAWDDIKQGVTDAVNALASIWGGILSGIETAFDAIKAWFQRWWPLLLPIISAVFLGPLGLLIGVVVDEIILHWHTLFNITKEIFGTIGAAVSDTWHFIDSVIRAVIGPLVPFISDAWQTVLNAARLAFDFLRSYFQIWWNVIQTGFTVWVAVLEGVLSVAWDTIRFVFTVVWDAIKAYFETWWDLIKGIVTAAWAIISGIFTVALDLIEGKWSAAWDTIKTTLSTVWGDFEGIITGAWGNLTGFLSGALSAFGTWWAGIWNGVSTTFSNIWNGISGGVSKIWGDIKGAFQAGISDVERLINSAFINPINTVLGIFGVKIKPFDTGGGGGGKAAGAVSGFGTGALGGGMKRAERGMVVNSPRVLVGEGGRGYPEWVIPSDPKYRDRAHGLLGSLIGTIGLPGMQSGGVHQSGGGHPWYDPGGVFSGAASLVSGAAHWAGGETVGPAIDAAVAAVDAVLPAGWFGRMATGAVHKIASAIKAWVAGKHPKGGTGDTPVGPLPSGMHKSLIDQALAIAGAAVNAADEAAVNLIVTHESGWNPNATNNWDINAQHGDPSRGLMQTIGSTFEAYLLPGLSNDIFDPLSNLVAGIRYAISRYGSLTNVPGVRAVAAGGSYVGYDTGGALPPGLTMAYNGTGTAEYVLKPTATASASPPPAITFAPGAVQIAVGGNAGQADLEAVRQAAQAGVEQGIVNALEAAGRYS